MIVHSAKRCVVWIKWDKTCSPPKWVENNFDLWSHNWINWLASKLPEQSDAAFRVGLHYAVYI